MRGEHAATAEELTPRVVAGVRPGDVVMVKGSLASGMRRVVAALRALDRQPRAANG